MRVFLDTVTDQEVEEVLTQQLVKPINYNDTYNKAVRNIFGEILDVEQVDRLNSGTIHGPAIAFLLLQMNHEDVWLQLINKKCLIP